MGVFVVFLSHFAEIPQHNLQFNNDRLLPHSCQYIRGDRLSCEKRPLTSSCMSFSPSVCSHVTARLPLRGLLRTLILEALTKKDVDKIKIWIKSQKIRSLCRPNEVFRVGVTNSPLKVLFCSNQNIPYNVRQLPASQQYTENASLH
jgi:hypothetical protein